MDRRNETFINQPCLYLYFKNILKKIKFFYFKLIFLVFSDHFILYKYQKLFFKNKKYYFNIFLNKKYFKKQS
jgi:hypothetical protein